MLDYVSGNDKFYALENRLRNIETMEELKGIIEQAWDNREELHPSTKGVDVIRDSVDDILQALDKDDVRIAEKINDEWQVNDWAKKAILLSFRLNDMQLISHGPSTPSGKNGGISERSYWYDKVPSKFLGWTEDKFKEAGFRAVPGCIVRQSAYIASGVVLMPSFVNLGAYIDEGTMVDTWATIGSCAQIGKNCHISGGAGIGGVLEPLQAAPVIIEDKCFIGARSEIAEGVIVEEGSVISMGVYIGASTKIIDRASGEIFMGRVPAYSVVVPGVIPGKKKNDPALYAAVVIKRVDEKTRSKTSINELLREG